MWLDWLVFCDCGFQSVYPLMEKDKRLMKTSWWDRLTMGETGSCSVGKAILSKSLIQFSVDGWNCVPSLLLTWGQTMVEVMKLMWPPSKDPTNTLPHSVLPTLQQVTTNPHPHWRPPDTHRQVWASLLWGPCSYLLGPGAQGSVCALQESISQSCVNSGSSMVGLMATSSKRAYAKPKSAAPRAPAPAAVHCWPVPP